MADYNYDPPHNFWDYFNKRLGADEKADIKEEARRLMEEDTDDSGDLSNDQIEALLRVYGKPPGIEDQRDWRTRPTQQRWNIERELDKDVRNWRTRPSAPSTAGEFVEPPRGGPSSYMRTTGKLSEMLSEVMEMAGPGRFLKALKGAFAGRKVPKLKGRTRQETADQAREWINWFNKGRK